MDAYSSIAGLYDPVTAAFLRGPRQEMRRACVKLRARRVLDVGCGTGILARMLAREVQLVAGLDFSGAMLVEAARHANRNTGRQGGRLFLVKADAENPPFVPASFDLAVFALTLHESAASPEAMLARAFELAPMVLALEWRLPERNLDYLSTAWVHIIERLAGREHYRHFRGFMRQGGLRGLAGRAGASIVWERPLKGNSLVLALLRGGA